MQEINIEQIEEIKKSGLFDNAIKYIASILSKGKSAPSKQYYADTLVFNEFGELLLLQRSSADDFEPSKWSLPGGKVEPGESSQKAAPRELVEETGIEAPTTYVNEWQDETCHIYYYMAQTPKSTIIILDTNEHYKYEWVALDELKDYDLLLNLGERLKELVGADIEGGKVTNNPFTFVDIEPLELEQPLQKSIASEIIDAFELISKAFDDGLINEDKFFFAKSQRDYLLSYHSLKESLDAGEPVDDLFLKALTEDFVSIEHLSKAESQVPLTASIMPGSDKVKKDGTHVGTGKHVDDLAEYARKTPLEKLMQFIKQSDDAELRKIAHQEVARREKEEKPNDDKPGGKEAPKTEPKPKAEAKPRPKPKPKPKAEPTAEESNPVIAADDSGNANTEGTDGKQPKDGSGDVGKLGKDEVAEMNAYLDADDKDSNPFLQDFHKTVDSLDDKDFEKEIDGIVDGANADGTEPAKEEDEPKPAKK